MNEFGQNRPEKTSQAIGNSSPSSSGIKICEVVPMEGVEPTHSHEYQILSLARLPIPPHRLPIK